MQRRIFKAICLKLDSEVTVNTYGKLMHSYTWKCFRNALWYPPSKNDITTLKDISLNQVQIFIHVLQAFCKQKKSVQAGGLSHPALLFDS